MINNPELIKQVINNIKKLSKEDLDKVMKEADEWYNKEVTDTNVGNIKEDIKILKEYLENYKYIGDELIKNDEIIKIIDYKEIKAIENLINAYERLQNKLLDIIEGTKVIEKETPEYIEESINNLKTLLFQDNLTQNGKQKLIEYYEEKIKELETKLEFKQFGDLDNIQFEDYINEFIPKQKIKDKIEQLKYRADGIAGTYQYADSQEHLQEKKNKVIELRTKAMALEELLKEVNK